VAEMTAMICDALSQGMETLRTTEEDSNCIWREGRITSRICFKSPTICDSNENKKLSCHWQTARCVKRYI